MNQKFDPKFDPTFRLNGAELISEEALENLRALAEEFASESKPASSAPLYAPEKSYALGPDPSESSAFDEWQSIDAFVRPESSLHDCVDDVNDRYSKPKPVHVSPIAIYDGAPVHLREVSSAIPRYRSLVGAELLASIPRLRALVAAPGSGMDRMLYELRDRPEFASSVLVVVADLGFVARSNGQDVSLGDVGWGALCAPGSWNYGLMIHVRDGYRRRRVGSTIARMLLEHATEPPRVFYGTERAALFWSTLGPLVRGT